jgi:type II secretory pathway pseudopilin PulG
MLIFNKRDIRGDTLIEVLFATAIFSLIAVGGLAIMNQGTAASQRAIEITFVRNDIDAQAETLRFLNASYVAAYQPGVSTYSANTPAGQWQLMQDSIKLTNNVNLSDFNLTNSGTCPTPSNGSFILDAKNALFIPPTAGKLALAQTFAQVDYSEISGSPVLSSANGIWIEAVRSIVPAGNSQDNAGYIDFAIRACWNTPGQIIPATIGTIVRLYEPRG